MDIRRETGIILKRGALFLGGMIAGTNEFRWRQSPYDAWITRNREAAERVARRAGCDLWLFNPIAGQLREIRR